MSNSQSVSKRCRAGVNGQMSEKGSCVECEANNGSMVQITYRDGQDESLSLCHSCISAFDNGEFVDTVEPVATDMPSPKSKSEVSSQSDSYHSLSSESFMIEKSVCCVTFGVTSATSLDDAPVSNASLASTTFQYPVSPYWS